MKPEMQVRHLVHRMGYRYRLHRTDLPGKPDLAFGPRRKVIFVHGCFWHQHDDSNCKIARVPKSRQDYWLPKLQKNHNRDVLRQSQLQDLGWSVLVLWECEIKRSIDSELCDRISAFLDKQTPV